MVTKSGFFARFARTSLLVVERDDELRAIVVDIATALGFAARATADVEDALEIAREHPPRILMLEVPLASPPPEEILRVWRAAVPGAWLIASTAHRVVTKPTLVGFDAVLRKPFGLEACERALTRAREGERGRWPGMPAASSRRRPRLRAR